MLLYNCNKDKEQQTENYWRDKTMTNKEYKEMLINNILEWQTNNQFTKEELEQKNIRTLERIHDNVI